MQQQDNKFSFAVANSNQMMAYNDDICKRILAYCEHYLNKYIQFLVPPQDCSCDELQKIIRKYNRKVEFPFDDVDLRYAEDDDVEACRDSTTPILPPDTADRSLTPSKIFRFAEPPEVARPYQTSTFFENEGTDEVDIAYIPEPFRLAETTKKPSRFRSLAPIILPDPLQARAFALPTPISPVPSVHDHKSSVVFLPEPQFPLPAKARNQIRIATTPSIISEKIPPTPSIRPKYTTQVSTISQKSNTVSLYSCWPPPLGIILISILEIILFFVNEKKPQDLGGRYTHGDVADCLMFDPYRRKEAWRFVTYLFVHIGLQHLLVNLAVQIFLGVILEMVHDRWRVLTIYMAGILAGSLGTSVFNPRVKLAGASGGVYALITAHIVTVILNWKHVQYPPTQLFVFLIIIVADFASGIRSIYLDATEDISYVAHGCGALAGFLVGFPVLRKLSEDKHVRWFQYVGLIVYLLLISAAVGWNIAATSFFPKQEV